MLFLEKIINFVGVVFGRFDSNMIFIQLVGLSLTGRDRFRFLLDSAGDVPKLHFDYAQFLLRRVFVIAVNDLAFDWKGLGRHYPEIGPIMYICLGT